MQRIFPEIDWLYYNNIVGGGGPATNTDLYKILPENDHGRFLTKILAELKKVTQVNTLKTTMFDYLCKISPENDYGRCLNSPDILNIV